MQQYVSNIKRDIAVDKCTWDPLWIKFIRVKSWKNDDPVHTAMRDEEETQKRFAMSDG